VRDADVKRDLVGVTRVAVVNTPDRVDRPHRLFHLLQAQKVAGPVDKVEIRPAFVDHLEDTTKLEPGRQQRIPVGTDEEGLLPVRGQLVHLLPRGTAECLVTRLLRLFLFTEAGQVGRAERDQDFAGRLPGDRPDEVERDIGASQLSRKAKTGLPSAPAP